MRAEMTVFIGIAQMFSSTILACMIGQLIYDEAILEKGSLKSFICFSWPSIKSGTWNIPEHSRTFRNIPEHEKIKIFFYEKMIN